MSDYRCVLRSNYFHVTDAEAFKKLMDSVSPDDLHLWEKMDDQGEAVFGFGCEGAIYGIPNENDDCNFDLFLEKLQKYIADGDAVILVEAGHEKLNYVTGQATIITKKEMQTIGIEEFALSKARDMVHNPDFNTQIDY